MKECLAHLGGKRIVQTAMKPMVEKVGTNSLDASGGSSWRKRVLSMLISTMLIECLSSHLSQLLKYCFFGKTPPQDVFSSVIFFSFILHLVLFSADDEDSSSVQGCIYWSSSDKEFFITFKKISTSKKQNIQLCPAHFVGIPEQVPIIAIPVRWKKRGCMSCRLFILHVCIAISSCPLPLLVRDFQMSLSLSQRTFLEGKKLCKRHESQAYTLFK